MKYLPKSSEILQTALARDEQVFDRYDCGLGVSGFEVEGCFVDGESVLSENVGEEKMK